MIRQYGPQRCRYETVQGRTLAVGVIPIGSIFRYQPPRAPRPETYMVEAWMPRVYSRGGRGGFVAMRGGHMAQVRALATGRPARLSDAVIGFALGA